MDSRDTAAASRALLSLAWLSGVAVVFALAFAAFADVEAFTTRTDGLDDVVRLGAIVTTGCLAVVAAFVSIGSDRSGTWTLLPLPAALIWFTLVVAQCVDSLRSDQGGALLEAAECVGFILSVGAILAVALLVPLYRLRPAAPTRVAALAGIGTSALAVLLLQFFHPFAPSILDAAAHGAAMMVLVGAAVWSPRLVPSL